MRAIVYVDGLNLYYGALKDTEHKWLDLTELARRLLRPGYELTMIRYFTARIIRRPGGEDGPKRQNAYLRALRTLQPEVKIHEGHFLVKKLVLPLADPKPGKQSARVVKPEEKGSDVNLAVHLLNDGWKNEYECAVVISNDSDLSEALRLARCTRPKKRLELWTPGEKRRTSKELSAHADRSIKIRQSLLSRCQLPDRIPGTNIRKPELWH